MEECVRLENLILGLKDNAIMSRMRNCPGDLLVALKISNFIGIEMDENYFNIAK
jgi:hypothetical protein